MRRRAAMGGAALALLVVASTLVGAAINVSHHHPVDHALEGLTIGAAVAAWIGAIIFAMMVIEDYE